MAGTFFGMTFSSNEVGTEERSGGPGLRLLSVEFSATFEGQFCFEVLEVAANAGDGRDFVTGAEHDGSSFLF